VSGFQQDGGSVRRRFAPREQPVFAAQLDRSERLLRSVVVDLEPSVFGVARQGDPVAQRVADGCALRASRYRRRLLLFQLRLQFCTIGRACSWRSRCRAGASRCLSLAARSIP
jgi:N-acetylglucosamine kinase-like BadF-type ATPase